MKRLGVSKENVVARGAARYKDLLYLALYDKKLQKKSVPHTRLGSVDEGELARVCDLRWRAAGMCVVKQPSEKLVVVSADGRVFTYVGGAEGEEQIPGVRDLRGCASVGGSAYAYGMNREVFHRAGEGAWTPMHAPGARAGEIAGFEALDGFAAGDLYAAGWEGEIWRYGDGAWSKCASPVGVILSAVCCTGDGQVYACGQSGTLVRGRGEKWQALKTDGVPEDLWDVRWFGGALYVASMSALYRWVEGKLVAVDFGSDPPTTFHKLTDAEGVLWSIGERSVASFDGTSWRRWE
ncbi:MAG: hypothetical protein KF782_13120 [Labilithrix sp.]|nr:hypothetical protein [Labilithrix sp.]